MAYQKQIYENIWHDTSHPYSAPKTRLLKGLIKEIQYSTPVSLGCGDGAHSRYTAGKSQVGIDCSRIMAQLAKHNLDHVIIADLDTSIPLRSGTIDLCMAVDIIEHLINTDNFLVEINRILHSSGKLILVTPNLASFTERILLLLGFQPQNIEVSQIEKFGSIRKTPPVGHFRGFTWGALREMLLYHGFEVQIFKTSTYYTGHLKLMDLILGWVRKTLASLFVLVCTMSSDDNFINYNED